MELIKLQLLIYFLFYLYFYFYTVFVINYSSSKSEEIAREKLRSSDADYFVALIKPKKFNDTIKGLTIYAEEKNSDNEFLNLYIKNAINSFQITYAEKGIFELKGNKQILVLYKGETSSSKNGKITNLAFLNLITI